MIRSHTPLRSVVIHAAAAFLALGSSCFVNAQPPPPSGHSPASASPQSLPPELQVISDMYTKGVHLREAKQYPEAITAFENVVRMATVAKANKSVILSAYSSIAVIYQETGNAPKYLELLHKIVDMDPGNSRAYGQLALMANMDKNYADAEIYANKALALKPATAIASSAHFVKGNVAVSHQDFALAGREFAESVRLEPTNAMAHFNYGLTLAERKNYIEAKKQLTLAHKLSPKDAKIMEYANKLDTYLAALKANPSSSVAPTQYDDILKKDPYNGPALLGRARLLEQLNKASDAESAYIQALAVVPNSYDGHYNLAHLYELDRNFVPSKDHFKKAQQIAEKAGSRANNAKAWRGLADAELQEGLSLADYRQRAESFQLSEAHAKQAIELQPNEPEFRNLLARAYEADSKFKEAGDVYRKMLESQPDNTNLYFKLANTFKAVRDYPGYVKTWKDYQVRRPDDPTSYQYITEIYNMLGKWQDSADTISGMLKQKLTNSVIAGSTVILAQDLHKLKKDDEARTDLKRVLDMEPSKLPTQYSLAEKAALETAQRDALKALAGISIDLDKPEDSLGYLLDLKKREAAVYKGSGQPPDGEVYKNIATIYERTRQLDKAVTEYQEMAKARPQDPVPHEELGRLLETLKKTDAAAQEYKRASVLNTKDPIPDRIKISEMYQRANLLDKATSELEDLNRAYPTKVEVLTELALVYRRTKQDEKALKIYDEIHKTNPSQGWVQDARAHCLLNLHRFTEAETVYTEEIDRNPRAGRQTYADLASIYATEGRADKFLDLIKPRFEKDPTNATAMAVVYDEFVRQKREKDGQAYIVGVISKSGAARRTCLQNYATVLQVLKRNPESLEIFRQIATENPKDVSAWVGLADELDFNALHDEANKVYVDQIARTDIKPDVKNELQYKLGQRYIQQNRLQDARAVFQNVVEHHKTNFDAAMRLGDLIERTGTVDEAISFYLDQLKIEYNYLQVRVDIRGRLARLYEKSNKKDDALKQYNEILKLTPDDAGLQAHIKKLQASAGSSPSQ